MKFQISNFKFQIKKRSAFTFIELTIAVLIFLIIAVSIYSTFRAGLKVWERSNPIIESNQSMRVFFYTISRDLKNAVSYLPLTGTGTGTDASASPVENFNGKTDSITLWTVVNSAGAADGMELAKVIYSIDKSAGTLTRSVAGMAAGFDEKLAKGTVVLKNIGEGTAYFKYCYKAAQSTNSGYGWKDEWADHAKIPRGVKITANGYTKTVFIPTGELGAEQ